MSYDLYFLVGPDREPLTRDVFDAYFSGRRDYTMEGDRAFYGSEDTGAHFWFDWTETADEDAEVDDAGLEDEAPDDELGPAGASFEMNYNRPFWFADEAEPEVRAFVEAMGLYVEDPQSDGMGRGPYSADGFRNGWLAGNRFALRVLRSQGAPEPPLLPGETVRHVHAWNISIRDLQASLGEAVYAPRVMFLLEDGTPRTFITWGWDIATAIPDVDRAIIGAPPRGLIDRIRRRLDLRVIDTTMVPATERVEGWIGGTYRLSPQVSEEQVRELSDGPKAQARPLVVQNYEVFERESYGEAVAGVNVGGSIGLTVDEFLAKANEGRTGDASD